MSYPFFRDWTEEDKDSAIKKLKTLETDFKKMGYDILLYGGTLLGAMRERDLILSDNDFDIIIFHTVNIKEEVKKQIIDIDNKFHNEKRLCGDLHFLGQNHYFVEKNWFDGWHGWIGEDDKFYTFYHINGELNKEDILPFKQIELKGEIFNIPKNPEKMLEVLYGKKWITPLSYKPAVPNKQLYQYFNGVRSVPTNKIFTQKELLLDLKSLLDFNGIQFWLQTGTLLGAVRDKDFIAHDPNDIDISLDINDRWKVKEILDKSDFKYKYQWDKELAVYKGNTNHPHVDLFFHTSDEKYSYCYSYKPNRIHKHWNEEWRMKVPLDLIVPLKYIDFLGTKFRVPNESEKYLAYLYGESWRIPNPGWEFTQFSNTDNTYSAITAVVTTLNREKSLDRLVKSFCNLYPDIPLIIGSQNKEPINITHENVTVLQLPEDCGLSYARNELVKQVKTQYTLLLEDDFILTRNTNIYNMMEVFSANKDIGIVGGRLWQEGQVKSYEKFLFILDKILLSIEWNKLVDNKTIEPHQINQIKYGICDIIYNFFLAKTEVLKNNPWDIKHKIHSEHMDFFLNIKLNSNVKIAFIPDVLIEHQHPVDDEKYREMRKRMYYNFIYEKYGIEKGYTLGESAIINYKENRRENV